MNSYQKDIDEFITAWNSLKTKEEKQLFWMNYGRNKSKKLNVALYKVFGNVIFEELCGDKVRELAEQRRLANNK